MMKAKKNNNNRVKFNRFEIIGSCDTNINFFVFKFEIEFQLNKKCVHLWIKIKNNFFSSFQLTPKHRVKRKKAHTNMNFITPKLAMFHWSGQCVRQCVNELLQSSPHPLLFLFCFNLVNVRHMHQQNLHAHIWDEANVRERERKRPMGTKKKHNETNTHLDLFN